jgi:hypothetical protein
MGEPISVNRRRVLPWQSWHEILGAAAAEGSVPADLQAKARQILKKILVAPIVVRPNAPDDWSFAGYSRFEGVVSGGLITTREQTTIIKHPYVDDAGRPVLHNPLYDSATGEERDLPPISGGSDTRPGTIRWVVVLFAPVTGPPTPPQSLGVRHTPGVSDRALHTRSVHPGGINPASPRVE